ncbi:ATP-grasp domain-containing protein [Streptomyces sp. NBC_01754]|uniref:ATP-grasp domain-containing protein n=1 Tax=Streptomyces sp. NBC_01754 TaxID=2975930 RepID=UPI002DDBB821|nr:ATP-grasp domain-containing protein [Streptomyces sp. NBC_01754]WSC90852.1 ATP-grasp domain-containing protein [Streptomyces sp. NBC_01754]WSC96653.1 ATP-grasp domain-containing protein [Streptomyces sp. NBC_01754]
MNTPQLLLVESNTTGTGRQFAQRARAFGAEPVLLTAHPGRYPYAAEDDLHTIVVDTADADALWAAVTALADRAPIAGVLSSSEYYVATAAGLARRLGLHGPCADAVRACRDKSLQRRALAAAGIPVPLFSVAGTIPEALAAAQPIGGPVVVKPVQGSGSLGVRLCHNPDEVAEHARVLLAATVNERGLDTPRAVLVEQYLTGREFSVEVFGQDAVVTVAKHIGAPPVFVETGHDVPALLPTAQAAALVDSAVHAVKALGLGWGAAHVELRLDGDVARVIEVNPRLAGGMIPELVRRARGIDLVGAQVRAALGEYTDLTRPGTDAAGAASIRFLTTRAASILTDPAAAQSAARAVPGVVDTALYRPAGTRVEPAEDFRGRLGHVITTGATPGRTAEAADTALAALAGALETPGSPVVKEVLPV